MPPYEPTLTERLMVRLTPFQAEQIANLCRVLHLPRTDWIRRAIDAQISTDLTLVAYGRAVGQGGCDDGERHGVESGGS